jgi:hypothetical protein
MGLRSPEFIGWSTNLAAGVAACLLKEAGATVQNGQGPVQRCNGEGSLGLEGKGPIDLGSHRVIVPSSFASRLIQEELAKQAPNGVLLPVFQTPTEFLNFGDSISGAKVQIGLRPVERWKGETRLQSTDYGGRGAGHKRTRRSRAPTRGRSPR